jgi:hypothetical protein
LLILMCSTDHIQQEIFQAQLLTKELDGEMNLHYVEKSLGPEQ